MAPSLVRGHADGAGAARFAGMREKAGTVEFEAVAAIFRIANPGGNPGGNPGSQTGQPNRRNMAGPDEPRKSRVM